MDKNSKTKKERRRKYNSDKISVQIYRETHSKLKKYCESNHIIMKDFLNEIILKKIN
jgi:hypothetical protein